jgi:hypothetical protein
MLIFFKRDLVFTASGFAAKAAELPQRAQSEKE